MEKVMDIIFKILGYTIIAIVATIEAIVKLISLVLFIPTILILMIICPIFNMEKAPELFQKWGQYMSENYLRGVKHLKKYYFG